MICILSPYGRGEVTTAAIRLADLVLSIGTEVRFVACGRMEKNVHPFWDSRVLTGRGEGVYKAARGCERVIHFLVDPAHVERVKLVAEKAEHILVPSWHDLRPCDVRHLASYGLIVAPTQMAARLLQQECFGGTHPSLTWCRWDAGLPPTRRDGVVADKVIRACFYCDASAIDFCGPLVLHVAHELLSLLGRLEITLLSTKSWSKQDRQEMKRFMTRWPGRLKHKRVGNTIEQAKDFHAHDWVVFPGVRGDFGINVVRALACGAPCVVYDVEPFSELISDDRNGVLVPCEVRVTAMKAPLAVPSADKLIAGCARAFADTQLLIAMQQRDWMIKEHQGAFNEAWLRAIGY